MHRSKRTSMKVWLTRLFCLGQPSALDTTASHMGQRGGSDTTATTHTNKRTRSGATAAPYSSQTILSDTVAVPHSGQMVITDTSAIPHSSQQVLSEAAAPPPNVTNLGTGPFANANNVVVNNAIFNDIQISPDKVASVMEALSKRAIDGAEYDSSARDPPPSCHPGTRIQLLEKIKAWFYDKTREKALLWLSGPAGVGKSAVIQTFAESLAESKSLGATLFFSRLNDRKDPQRVVATISFQLATRIPTYRAYVAEKITLDPSLLRKGMKEQFQILIVEPFGNGGIGKGEGSWGILLDGLDECEGVEQQREIVRLISEFVLNFPNVPLVWSISSRPEPHIVATFTNKAIALSHWSEYIPINSTEGCQDVERYLNNSFESMRSQFPHVPSNWPTETQFLKLTNGASGLFVFARTAVRFMEDPNHADPVSRLNLLLSVIDHLDVAVTDEHPFALLDALYNHILVSIPRAVWPTTKRILGFYICSQPRNNYAKNGLSYPLESRSLMAASIILNIEQHVMYSSLHKLHSVLEIPHPDTPHKSGVSFFHASFGDYLTDLVRSNDFFIDRGEAVDNVTRGLYRIYTEAPWEKKWASHTDQLSRTVGRSFYEQLKEDAVTGLSHIVTGDLRSNRGRGPFKSEGDRSECLTILGQIDITELYWSGDGRFIIEWLFKLWRAFPDELKSKGLFEEVSLTELRVDHLKHEKYICAVFPSILGPNRKRLASMSSIPFQDFEATLQLLLQQCPEKGVLVYGNSPQKRNAFIQHDRIPDKNHYRKGFYCFSYP